MGECADRLLRRLFRLVCVEPSRRGPVYDIEQFDAGLASARRFFERFRPRLELAGKTVLDAGCGRGSGSVYAALEGARRVLGVDIRDVSFARTMLEGRFPELASRVEFRRVDGLRELGGERFDLVISKDALEHVADPAGHVDELKAVLRDDGLLAIGFGPLWKSPYGGHIDFMTKLPWAHLLFPEAVVMSERRRFRPDDPVSRYEDVSGGLNRMTLARFRIVMEESGLECVYFATNFARSRLVTIARLLAGVPLLREYFTLNVYSLWRRPRSRSSRRRARRYLSPPQGLGAM